MDNEESEVQVDLKQISKTPLKAKGTTNSAKKTKKKMGKASTPNTGGKKKATFAETVGKDTVKEKEIDYKTCVVRFAVRVDKGKDTKGGFDKKIIKGLNFMQTYIDQNTSFHATRPGMTAKPIKGISTCQNIKSLCKITFASQIPGHLITLMPMGAGLSRAQQSWVSPTTHSSALTIQLGI